jgi:serine/threonine-protein kinase
VARLRAAEPGRFAPGQIIAERYRVVGLLGRGGMGEVYRADDLKLEQPVALKFLPEAVEGDPERLARFFNEARLARQVTHAAVCRVHDIGEVDGHPYLSMEFVDGEDLGSLLKRIGRLSPDKAAELGRQVCAGLAAAHAKGVLHRDLKPGNVMIDGQGHARITDFGLAGLAEGVGGDDVRSGTPAYMSPEQLDGREVTPRSDLYSLGLLLYELFSGRRAFDGKTLAEVMRQRAEPPRPLAELVPEIAPPVAAAVTRCLERDPARRPPTALAVAAALGADPLASALAEGHTPSPELVAAAGEAEGRLAPAMAWACVAVIAATVIGAPLLVAPIHLMSHVPMAKEPAVLEDRAREIVRRLGYVAPPVDSAVGWAIDAEHLRSVRRNDASRARWEGLKTGAPPVLHFWYRQSPRVLVTSLSTRHVYWSFPPWNVSGMVAVKLDPRGRLVCFYAVPPQLDPEPTEGPAPEFDFRPLFEEAGFDFASFRPVPSEWAPPFAAEVRRAWLGRWPERSDLEVRIEAAAHRGRPVAFYPVASWTRPERDTAFAYTAMEKLAAACMAVLFVSLVAVAAVVARRHHRAGRADRGGAARLAGVVFAMGAGGWALAAHHVPLHIEEVVLLIGGLSTVLFFTAVVWLFYLALEPIVRRLWPHALISWSRLVRHGPREPLVARDTLVGLAAGGVIVVLIMVALRLQAWLGQAPSELVYNDWGLDALISLRYAFAQMLTQPLASIGFATGSFLILALLRLLFRNEWLAAGVFVALTGMLQALRWDLPLAWGLPLALLIMLDFVLVALRFGLVAFTVALFTVDLVIGVSTTLDFGSWTSEPTRILFLTVLALAAYGFHYSQRPAPAARPRS